MHLLNDIRLIGLVGAAGSGKDTLADQMQSWTSGPWERVAFADALKRICVEYLGLSESDVRTQAGKARFNEFWGMTNREVLQRVGTEAMRNGFCQDVWVKIARLRIESLLDEGRRVVVTDCRFDNEAALVRELGGVVLRVERPSAGAVLTAGAAVHASEAGVSEWMVDGTVRNSSTVEQLGRSGADLVRVIERRMKSATAALDALTRRGAVDEPSAELLLRLLKTAYGGVEGSVIPGDCRRARIEWRSAKDGALRAVEVDAGENRLELSRFRSGASFPEYDKALPAESPEVREFLRDAAENN